LTVSAGWRLVFVLGVEGQKIFDLPLVLDLTRDWRASQKREEADRERNRLAEERRLQDRYKETPDGRLAELEWQIAELQETLSRAAAGNGAVPRGETTD
jgi:hypothetical protein